MVKSINKMKKSTIILVLLCIALLTCSFSYCYAYYFASGQVTMNGDIVVYGFAPKINNSSSFTQFMNLANTITNNKNLAPGAEGNFNINIDFTDVNYDAEYAISFDNSNIPNNLHFYTDSNYTNSLTTIEDVKLLESNDQFSENTIYWRWNIVNDSASNINDNLFINQIISIPFTINITQHIS